MHNGSRRDLSDAFLGPGICDGHTRCPRTGGWCACNRHATNLTNAAFSNRLRLFSLMDEHPDLIDAKLTYIPEGFASLRPLCEEHGWIGSSLSPSEHASYKFVLSTDGSTIDDTRVHWMLGTGSLLFKQITPLVPFGLPSLEPFVHYVPVREDLQDLPEKVRWAVDHDEDARRIAENAREYVARFSRVGSLGFLSYVLQAIAEGGPSP